MKKKKQKQRARSYGKLEAFDRPSGIHADQLRSRQKEKQEVKRLIEEETRGDDVMVVMKKFKTQAPNISQEQQERDIENVLLMEIFSVPEDTKEMVCAVNYLDPCERKDTVKVGIFVPNGTREGERQLIGPICMEHLPMFISTYITERGGYSEFLRNIPKDFAE